MHGIDSALRTDSSLGTDSTLEPIPCNSNSGSFGNDSNMIPVPGKNGIITPLFGIILIHPVSPVAELIRLSPVVSPFDEGSHRHKNTSRKVRTFHEEG